MMSSNLARVVDLLAMSLVFGATAWFFFIQSPVFLRQVGREAFVPTQMRLTVVLFRTLTAALVVMAAAAAFHAGSPTSILVLSALLGLAASVVNQFVVVPRALRAGGRSRREIKGKNDEASTAGFASEGAGNETRALHRTVVLFVVVMLAGVIRHGVALVSL